MILMLRRMYIISIVKRIRREEQNAQSKKLISISPPLVSRSGEGSNRGALRGKKGRKKKC